MRWQYPSGRYVARLLMFFLSFGFPDTHAKLVVSPVGPTEVNAVAGSNVTLSVSYSGALDPTVTWFMGTLPVVTWTIGLDASPDIPNNIKRFLKVEPDGSLTFLNVPVNYTSSYRVSMTKAGLGTDTANFSLKVFEIFKEVTLVEHGLEIEGSNQFTLQYRMEQGVVEEETWLFNGREIETGAHYSLGQQSLVIDELSRSDTGEYSVVLMNPFSLARVDKTVTVLYGPDEPSLKAMPAQEFYVTGDSLNLSCQADGSPKPTVKWMFDGQSLSDVHKGVLNLTNVQTSQGGIYTCWLLNEGTNAEVKKNITVNIYEKPSGSPVCSVKSDNNVDLQYSCQWSGGTPQAQLSFPALSTTSSGGHLSLTIASSDNLNGKTVTCVAKHPVEERECSITAKSPSKFLPTVRTTVDRDGKIVVSIRCVSEATPAAVVSWFIGEEAINNVTMYEIGSDTTQLDMRDYNVSTFLQRNYNCTCHNLLGSRSREIHLQGPSISDSSLFTNQNGTVITLTWEVPPYSIVTGFDIQMKGPDLLSERRNGTQSRDDSTEYNVIQQKPGSARSVDVYPLDPESRYWFRVIPRARMVEGESSAVHSAGPAEGLSGPAIAGIAAGIPCSILFLLLLCGLIYFCIYSSKNRSRQTRYPMSRAVEKAITTQSDPVPHNLLIGGLKLPPDYNRLQHTPSERSADLPRFVPPPPPVRVATTV